MPEKILTKIYQKANSENIAEIDTCLENHLDVIANNSLKLKGVYTVIITLGVYKILNPNQDIRNHQESMPNGFSGRSFDTKFITPTLAKLDLPFMSESGWLTRSLEQPLPYNKEYPGKISNKLVKESFLEIVDYIEHNPKNVEDILIVLLNKIIPINNKNKIATTKISNPDIATIPLIIKMLKEHFEENYKTHGGAKLPVIAFHSIYEILVKELARFSGCVLGDLGYNTTSDRTSGQVGDIQIYNSQNNPFEGIEIKLGQPINVQFTIRARDKILKTTLQRYYILSSIGIVEKERVEIEDIINKIKDIHGCQVIVNGLYETLKYYLRLVSNLNEFLNYYDEKISKDIELQPVHKDKWKEILSKNNLI
ncbi:MAG: hypothetical protein LBH40_05645 [Alphaproteobacteria bacterium]|jgi:DNA (cytosine-5)-methyltransferase 1|nr:hypothetical protein [Alphaproteobacteria bacterium]